MKYALINNNSIVDNIIVADPAFIETIRPDWFAIVDLTPYPDAAIGDTWTGSEFQPPAPAPLEERKQSYVEATRSKAYNLLLPTDWLVVRKVENGAEIPTDWNNWRESIRVASNEKVTAINACETQEELTAYVSSYEYTYWPPEPTTPAVVLG